MLEHPKVTKMMQDGYTEPEPPVRFYCHGCGEPVLKDENYFIVAGRTYCEYCVRAVATQEEGEEYE